MSVKLPRYSKPRFRGKLSVGVGLLLALTVPTYAEGLAMETIPGMSLPTALSRSTAMAHVAAATRLQLSVSLAPAYPTALESFVERVSNPSSPEFRKFITPSEVGKRFGPSAAKVQAMVTYLKAKGMTVTLVGQNGFSILAEGTAAQAEKAFSTRLVHFRTTPLSPTDRGDYYSYTQAPSLPSTLASSVVHIGGLENSTQPVPRALTASQARSLYKTASFYSGGFQGQGRNIAISNFDGYRLSNVPLYYSNNGLPTPPGGVGSNIKVVTAGTAAGPGTPQGEGDLDIQMVLGQAPLCNFTIYDGKDLIAVLTKEVNDNTADIISESYGWKLPASMAASAHNLHLAMSAQGITYLAASGDYGTNLEPYSYPNYEPEVLQVGGTIATVDGSGNRTSETGWSGSGGGYSTNTAAFNTLPSWQKGTGVPTNINKRLCPDISLNAAGNNGAYPFYYKGVLSNAYVGTSFAAPVLAGMLGVAEQKLDALGYFGSGKKRLGRLQDLIYAQNGRSDVWNDIVTGANGNLPNGTASTARVGWDAVTGWGAMNVDAFVTVLSGSTPPPSTPPTTPPTTTYLPSSVGIFVPQGTGASGSLSSLTASDTAYYSVSSVSLTGVGLVATVKTTFTLPSTATSATVKLVANGPSGAAGQIFALNVTTGVYDLVLNSVLSGADKTFTVSLPNLALYRSSAGVVTLVERSIKGSGSYVLKTNQFVMTTP